jgi:hypothetical protein
MAETATATADTTTTTTASTTAPAATAPAATAPAPQFAGKYATEAEFATALTGIATKRGLDLAVPDGKKLIGDVFTKDTAEMLYKQLAGKALTDAAPAVVAQPPAPLDDAGVKAEMVKAGLDLNAIVAQAVAGTAPDKATLAKIGAAALKANPELVGQFVIDHNKLGVADFQRRTTDAQAEARKVVGADKADRVLEWAKNNMGEKWAETEARWKNPATASEALLYLSGLHASVVPAQGPADSSAGRPAGGGGSAFSTTAEWKVAFDEAAKKYGDPMDDPVYRARAVATAKQNPAVMRG